MTAFGKSVIPSLDEDVWFLTLSKLKMNTQDEINHNPAA